MLRRVALVTCREHPDLPEDDRPLVAELGRLGIAASARLWDDPAVPWPIFDAIVLRATWDYHLRIEEFRRWIDSRDAEGATLWNPAPLLTWNTHKFYLRELETKGIPIAPSRFLPSGTAADLAAILEEENWDCVVIKPAVSATAHRTHRLDRQEAARLGTLVADGDTLVQQYLPEIETRGEWSLVYLDGSFSHAVRKLPASGDFRVQTEFGGRAETARPDPGLVLEADRVIAAIDSPWLYARVDGVESAGGLRLMELELVEPSLFLSAAPDAARRFAAAIGRTLDGERLAFTETRPAADEG
jgi:glutathione synthase/RimK-type ligase-like ATP-grasp enzyme